MARIGLEMYYAESAPSRLQRGQVVKVSHLHYRCPDHRQIPIFAHSDDHIKVTSHLISRVERNPPEATQEGIISPEPGRVNGRRLCQEHTNSSGEEVDGEAHSCAYSWRTSESDANTQDLSQNKASIVDEKANPPHLVGDISATI